MAMKTNEEYIREIAIKNPNIEVIDKYIGANQKILHRCKICDHKWHISPHNVLRGNGCSVCGHRVIGKNYENSIWTSKYRELAEYYHLSEEQMKTMTPMTNKKIIVKCPNCGNAKSISICHLFKSGLGCSRCSDGISYSEKFMASILEQLNIDYESQYVPNWSGSKRYDFYLPNYNCIIETHGSQHYKGWNKDKCNLEAQQQNDNLKISLAKANGINNYIVINCSESTLNFLKNSIMNSDMMHILNFKEEDIEWQKCNLDALSSKVKNASDLWNENQTMAVSDIADILGVSYNTVVSWLKKASMSNMCDYTIEKSKNRGVLKNSGINSKLFGTSFSEEHKRKLSENHTNVSGANNPRATKVICIETNKIYQTIDEVSCDTGANRSGISNCCNKRTKTAGNYHWKYADNITSETDISLNEDIAV